MEKQPDKSRTNYCQSCFRRMPQKFHFELASKVSMKLPCIDEHATRRRRPDVFARLTIGGRRQEQAQYRDAMTFPAAHCLRAKGKEFSTSERERVAAISPCFTLRLAKGRISSSFQVPLMEMAMEFVMLNQSALGTVINKLLSRCQSFEIYLK